MIWPVLVYGGMVVALVAAMIVASHFLGQRHSLPRRDEPYESGIKPTGSARLRYGARYYLVGVFFLIFDVEAAILFGWAVAFRELGWTGYIGAVLFIATLGVGLVFVWKLGGLDWYPGSRRNGGSRE